MSQTLLKKNSTSTKDMFAQFVASQIKVLNDPRLKEEDFRELRGKFEEEHGRRVSFATAKQVVDAAVNAMKRQRTKSHHQDT